jgi:hypothetical protein
MEIKDTNIQKLANEICKIYGIENILKIVESFLRDQKQNNSEHELGKRIVQQLKYYESLDPYVVNCLIALLDAIYKGEGYARIIDNRVFRVVDNHYSLVIYGLYWILTKDEILQIIEMLLDENE